jgi:hypothetical protein
LEELTFAEDIKKFPPFCGMQIFVAGYTGSHPEPEGFFQFCIFLDAY